MILTIERKEIPTILVNKKWIQRKKDTISAEYDERKVFSYLKKRRRRRKKKILKVTRPLSLLPPKNPHTQKKIKARPPRCISGFIMGNNQKCRSKTVEHILFFPVLIWSNKKKRDFTLLFISLVGTTHVSSTAAASKACKITMEAMAGRIEQTARPGCTSYSLRSENHQLPSNSDWVEKHLKKKPPKHITAAAAEADHRVSSLVASAALRKSSL